ncbi:pentatricopeptide repeat-containing protein At4g21170-like [Chenopodium quinoa]|uniref:pentatricopeptide repeat-containing protein At4g21170-like n=1 Tax=Chenopodium quinoa TaxID=63459 RepID=UPI000B77E6A2|nr:pentatricopeptide repeat-containing protein At4g21170-like [Chenopodium quinoa]
MSLTKTLHCYHFIKTFSAKTSSTSSPTSSTWRIQAQERQLISQISSILLQRHNWQSLLKTLYLSPKLTPPIFLQILHKTQENPQISLNFFNWAKSNLVGFQPDLKIHCKIFQILIGSGQTHPIKPILDSFIGVNPPTQVVRSMIQACKGTNLRPLAFSSIIECYAQKGFYFDGLKVYREIISYGYLPKTSCVNVVLDVLDHASEYKLAYCLYGSMIRNGIVPNASTWTVIARILCKNGKFENVVRLLDSGVCNSAVFDLVIDGYSRIGNFEAAIDQVNEMCERNFEPGFCTYGSILDGACKFWNSNVIDTVMCAMRERALLPKYLSSKYDDVIRKFCEVGKSYAAEFLFNKARDEGVGLENATFECMLRAFCKGGRVDELIGLYQIISKEKVVMYKSCYEELVESLCKGTPSEKVNQLLIHLIVKGFSPSVSGISKFMMKLGGEENWKDIEALLNIMLQADILPDSVCCRLLVKHYCSSGQIESALLLHNKLDKSEILWDVTTYNILLRKLLTEDRVDEAFKIFECMRSNNVVNRASFLVMISGLSQVKDMRKAMQVHDDMLKMGLKPSSKTYKSLISVFR